MSLIRPFFKLLTFLIYGYFLFLVLAFPILELLQHISRETRMSFFDISFPIQIKDVILPSLLLSLIYAGIAALQRRLQPKPSSGTAQVSYDHERVTT
ncbi:MAG: hypothetical protein C4520_18990 [Candidatus Abyssobacteria bacterium SURF_5]|uniref:Uncharacterized protein n=1 Tax=Abyssobacteria bacterium (strain SURF_5) TaxID=2093360 RepID=A0A3A4N1Z6_ABYX5|nr:MAG: hypothetical protein C4520_18990 [Candidatus Abyssubacteria bacterium SURF_5]